MTVTIRLVLADDQAMIRAGLALVLSGEPDIEVTAQCSDGRELLSFVQTRHVDLVLTDIRMPEVDGIEAAAQMRALPDAPPVLALTTFDDDDVLWPALHAGVNGFVLKDSPAESLVEAVRAVAAGGTWLDPRVLPRVVQRAVNGRPAPSPVGTVLDALTTRERQVLDLVCRGASNLEISTQIYSSERTVKAHMSAILQKLGARDRAGAIIVAYDAGWRPTPPTTPS